MIALLVTWTAGRDLVVKFGNNDFYCLNFHPFLFPFFFQESLRPDIISNHSSNLNRTQSTSGELNCSSQQPQQYPSYSQHPPAPQSGPYLQQHHHHHRQSSLASSHHRLNMQTPSPMPSIQGNALSGPPSIQHPHYQQQQSNAPTGPPRIVYNDLCFPKTSNYGSMKMKKKQQRPNNINIQQQQQQQDEMDTYRGGYRLNYAHNGIYDN